MSEEAHGARAWIDEDDVAAQEEMPAFLKQSHVKPSWATAPDARGEEDDDDAHMGSSTAAMMTAATRKRFRSDDLDALLSRTEPLLSSKHDRVQSSVPTVLSVLPLPRDQARSVTWHRSGQLAIVGGNHHVYAFHAAGKFVEQLSKVDVVKRVEQTVLTASGDEVIVVNHESYVPQLLSLASEKIVSLGFLDTRSDAASHRNGRRDNIKKELFISKMAVRQDDTLQKMVALASGNTVKLGALTSGSVLGHIQLNDAVSHVSFTSPNEISIAAGNKLLIYDIRKTARFLSEVVDEGSLGITSFAVSPNALAIGSSSGVVNVYSRDNTKKPIKALKNLTTPIQAICFGENSAGDHVLAFSSKGQKAAVRLAKLPDCQVVPSFPAVGIRHEFIQSMCIAPTVPILSVGERQKVTNYAL